MNWELQLISDYIIIDKLVQQYGEKQKYRSKLRYCTDSEILAAWFWGLRKGMRSLKSIHDFTCEMLCKWFPTVPGYQQFDKRLNKMANLIEICFSVMSLSERGKYTTSVIDSMPVVLASAKRSSRASVAKDIANKGYCSSKDQYYHGVKLHLVIAADKNRAPFTILLGNISPASEHDVSFLKNNRLLIKPDKLYADKAYISSELADSMKETGIELIIPDKKSKNRELNLAQHFRSCFVSSTRQAIETSFSWLQARTGLATASKVRSSLALRRQIFGSLLAAQIGCV